MQMPLTRAMRGHPWSLMTVNFHGRVISLSLAQARVSNRPASAWEPSVRALRGKEGAAALHKAPSLEVLPLEFTRVVMSGRREAEPWLDASAGTSPAVRDVIGPKLPRAETPV